MFRQLVTTEGDAPLNENHLNGQNISWHAVDTREFKYL